MSDSVRVRIAPSPTGSLHIGNVRAGLFNYLFAKHHGGTFILRIDDTDEARSKPEHIETIKNSLRWVGLDWDEGPDVGGPYEPYFQSKRFGRYAEAAKQLLDEGKAFRCWCTAEELEAKRQVAARLKQAPRYDGTCLHLTPDQQKAHEAAGRKSALRFKVPEGPPIVLDDLIRGRVEFPREMFDHFIIVRSDGKPVYNFCTALDEADHRITHVIRGDDHLSNTPKQTLIMEALGIAPPKYAHLPQILGIDKARLSKRHGSQGVLDLRDDGYLKEAVINFLALLGWSYDDKTELFTKQELIEKFDLGRVGKAPAVFDEAKLEWMNGQYIRSMPAEALDAELTARLNTAAGDQNLDPKLIADGPYRSAVFALAKDSLKTLSEIVPLTDFFFRETVVWQDDAKAKLAGWPKAAEILAAIADILKSVEPFTAATIEAAFRAKAESLGLKFKDLVHPARFAVSGRAVGPSLFHMLEVLGRERCAARLTAAGGMLPR